MEIIGQNVSGGVITSNFISKGTAIERGITEEAGESPEMLTNMSDRNLDNINGMHIPLSFFRYASMFIKILEQNLSNY